MVQKVTSSILVSRPINNLVCAGIVQWLVCKFSKLEMRVRFSLPAPEKVKITTCGYFLFSMERGREKSFLSTRTIFVLNL